MAEEGGAGTRQKYENIISVLLIIDLDEMIVPGVMIKKNNFSADKFVFPPLSGSGEKQIERKRLKQSGGKR
jgi:hypothetical protein